MTFIHLRIPHYVLARRFENLSLNLSTWSDDDKVYFNVSFWYGYRWRSLTAVQSMILQFWLGFASVQKREVIAYKATDGDYWRTIKSLLDIVSTSIITTASWYGSALCIAGPIACGSSHTEPVMPGLDIFGANPTVYCTNSPVASDFRHHETHFKLLQWQ